MPLNPDIVRDSHRNKQRGGETQRARERENGGVVNNNHPPPEPELLLSLFVLPTFWFQTKKGGSGRGEGGCIPLALACASISPPHIKAVISRSLWECKAACAPSEWMWCRSREELGRWHWLSSPSVRLSGSGDEISLSPFLPLLFSVTHCGVTSHTWSDEKNVRPQVKENSKKSSVSLFISLLRDSPATRNISYKTEKETNLKDWRKTEAVEMSWYFIRPALLSNSMPPGRNTGFPQVNFL